MINSIKADRFQQDVFYAIETPLSRDKQRELLVKAMRYSMWAVDKKDDDYCRQKIDMSQLDIMQIFDENESNHVVYIHRMYPEIYWEIGFCTMGLPYDYFLWIWPDDHIANKLIEEYNLKPL